MQQPVAQSWWNQSTLWMFKKSEIGHFEVYGFSNDAKNSIVIIVGVDSQKVVM